MLQKLICSFGALALITAFSPAVTLNSLDTFEDLTVMNWSGGASPTNFADGSNGSARSLQISSGTFGFASHLASHNSDPRYIGNYTSAGATAIEAWFKNTGDTVLEMRLVLFTGFSDRWTSTTSFPIAPGSGWVKATFSVSALTQVAGTGSLAALLSNVEKVMFRNNTGAPSSGGTAASGRVQIDNVQVIGATTVSGHVNSGGGRTLSSMLVQLRNAGTLTNV
ncbi:MAG: hypothetical protein K8R88_07020, partial [Armatimonadetes bacterium]|nr:hypothetical protein [Armatimonadota bacterium]